MNKIILFFILLLISLINFGQNSWQTLDSLILSTPLNDSVSKYYKYVYKAEDYIMKGKFDKAASKYQKAFAYIEFPFYRDLNYAINCELLSNVNEENIRSYVWFIINKTGDKEAFYNDTSINKLSFWPKLEFMIDTMTPGVDTALLRCFDEILNQDQEYRMSCSQRFIMNNEKIFRDSLVIIDSLNINKTLGLIGQIGNLSEEQIGLKWEAISTLLIHSKNRPEVFIATLNAVVDGKINAVNYSFNLANSYFRIAEKYSLGQSYFYVLHKFPVILFSLSRREKNHIDKYRRKMYLVSMDRQIEKIIWNCNNSRSFYKNSFATNSAVKDSLFYNMLETKTLNGNKIKVYYFNQNEKRETMHSLEQWEKSKNEQSQSKSNVNQRNILINSCDKFKEK